jgi:carboxyl-terminal processing protease
MPYSTRFLATRLLALTLFAVPLAAGAAPASAKSEDGASTYELLNLFGEVFDRVRSDYVEPVADQKLIESALNGMLTSLDPHSSYMNKKSFEDMKVQTKGEFGGLGIEVTMENGLVKVVSPIDETPAAKAGIKPGDYISEIDGEQVMGLSLSDAVDKMRGPVGTTVKITILREGAKEPFSVTLKRDVIKIQSVRSRTEGDIVYLRINSFSENTSEAMTEAFQKETAAIKKATNAAPKGIVLDLRNNPGGLLDQAIAVSDAFLEKGEIVSTRSRNPSDSRRYSATAGDISGGLPIVVIINEGSASASEIVAGALKDHKRAVALGIKSFGKGSVQTVIPIDGHGAIRLTTARYYTPAGTSIQATGIVPDITVQQAKVETLTANTNLSEATLRGHLLNEQLKNAKESPEKTEAAPLPPAAPSVTANKDLSAEQDYQLSRALDLIRALSIYGNAMTAPAASPVAEKPAQQTPAPFSKKR